MLDRVALIIEIFNAHAYTKEAKLQVLLSSFLENLESLLFNFQLLRGVCPEEPGFLQAELAALMYKKSRLVRVRSDDGRYTFGFDGEAEVVSARG